MEVLKMNMNNKNKNKLVNEFDEFPDPEMIKKMLDIVSEKIPELLKELSGVLYSPDQAKQFGLSAAIFYKELKAAGMTDEQAFMLTNQYMSTMNIGSTMKGVAHNHGHSQGHGHSDNGCYGHGDGNPWEIFREFKKFRNHENREDMD
jgi:hypothetical protein